MTYLSKVIVNLCASICVPTSSMLLQSVLVLNQITKVHSGPGPIGPWPIGVLCICWTCLGSIVYLSSLGDTELQSLNQASHSSVYRVHCGKESESVKCDNDTQASFEGPHFTRKSWLRGLALVASRRFLYFAASFMTWKTFAVASFLLTKLHFLSSWRIHQYHQSAWVYI